MRSTGLWVVAIASILTWSSPAGAEDAKPDATLQLKQSSVAIVVGYTWGSGTLVYQGKSYPVEVDSLFVVALGFTQAEATGEVFNLKKVEDLDGTYTAMSAEGTLGSGAGATTMRNQNGVLIYLFTTTEGLSFKTAPEGVRLRIK